MIIKTPFWIPASIHGAGGKNAAWPRRNPLRGSVFERNTQTAPFKPIPFRGWVLDVTRIMLEERRTHLACVRLFKRHKAG